MQRFDQKMTKRPEQDLTTAYRSLIDSQKTLLLSTPSVTQGAEISYAPYVQDKQGFYIYVSELAKHTANMLINRQASILFIQPETEADNLFARERVMFNCRVQEVTRDEPLYDEKLQSMQSRFGETVSILRSLTDFHLLQLIPVEGQYIAGFGKAFAIDLGNGRPELITKK